MINKNLENIICRKSDNCKETEGLLIFQIYFTRTTLFFGREEEKKYCG